MDGAATLSITPDYLDESLLELRARLWRTLESRVHGLCFSAYLAGEGPDDATQLSEAQIRARMEIIAPYCRWIRTFSCTDGNERSPRIAHELGLKTLVGAWIGTDRDKNEIELAAAIEVARRGEADILAIGNEVLLRQDVPEAELLEMIRRAKAACPDVSISYVDAYYLFEEHPQLIEACDVLCINCYPFWEKFSLTSSVGNMREMVDRVRRIAGGKRVIISETGWPTRGAPVGEAVPSPENAAIYALNAFEWTAKEGIEMFYFAAFDEAWKTGPEGDCGDSWGFWDQNGERKA